MSDDWRLRIELGDTGEARALGRLLGGPELEHDLANSFADRVTVSVDGAEVFCYAGTREQAQRAQRLIDGLARRHGWSAAIDLARWHPVAERWEDPDTPLPAGDVPGEPEHEERVAREREESARQGYPEFEVRVQCESRRGAHELSRRLEDEGLPNIRRHDWVLIGADDEDSAQRLAKRLRDELGAGRAVTVEANALAVYDERIWSPFTVLGGLGG